MSDVILDAAVAVAVGRAPQSRDQGLACAAPKGWTSKLVVRGPAV